MSDFPHKQYNGVLYKFEHLIPIKLQVPLNSSVIKKIDLHVTFGCHCFTERFDHARHLSHHRYGYNGELRAFSLIRHECSLQLPTVMESMLQGRIYHVDGSYTYAAHVMLASLTGTQRYSVFFALEKNKRAQEPALRMFVKSAYLKLLVAPKNAQSWRFVSLAGQISGAFSTEDKKPRPQRKKAP